jgi:hypothetical protein
MYAQVKFSLVPADAVWIVPALTEGTRVLAEESQRN